MQTHRAFITTNYIQPQMVLPVVMGAPGFSLSFMLVLVVLGLPMFLLVVLFIGSIFLAIYSFTYEGRFWLFDDRVEEQLTPKLSFSPFIKPKQNVYNLSELESYLFDSDMTRYYGERKYLKLFFAHPKRVIAINEGNEADTKKQFAAFAQAFFLIVNDASGIADKVIPADAEVTTTIADNTPTAPTAAAQVTTFPNNLHARARKGFYKTFLGKIVTMAFVVLTAYLLLVAIFPSAFGLSGFGFANSLKLGVLVLPGTVYMVGRTFGKQGKKQ
jgi:hypothetical protein